MVEKLMDRPEIFRIFIPLPDNPLKYLNSYVLHDGDEWLMIDTGFNREECRRAMEEGIRELRIDLSKTKLFLTHLHGDHTGLAGYFTEKGIIPYMGKCDHEILRGDIGGESWGKMAELFESCGFPEEELKKQAQGNQAMNYSPKAPFDVKITEDGDEIEVGSYKLRCICVPGHTPGQFCLYMPGEKILFSADHVLFDITPNISLWLSDHHSLENYLASLDRIASLEVKRTFPGHREFAGDLYERIRALKMHHRARLLEVWQDIAQHPDCQPYDTAGRISWSARGRKWSDFNPNQRWFAMGETMAHLEWLLNAGYVSQDETHHFHTVKALPWTEDR